jgi:branched-chain amino acid aminotransferase
MSIKPSNWIWHRGELIPWEKATVHVLSHAIHYGTSVFEGIRCYQTDKGPAFFRLKEHAERLMESAHIYKMPVTWTAEDVRGACHKVVAVNGLKGAYIRPIIFYGYGSMGVMPTSATQLEMSIAAFEWGAYLGADGLNNGIDVCVTSWHRAAPNTHPQLAKAGGNYLASFFMVDEARRHGYTEAIALNSQGFVSEGPGENLFIIRRGKIYTPSIHCSILEGITRDTVMTLARDLGYEVEEGTYPRELLYLADELFFTGTAAEVTPIRSVDGRKVGSGKPGPVTQAIQKAFFGLFKGETVDKWGWLERVQSQPAPSPYPEDAYVSPDPH